MLQNTAGGKVSTADMANEAVKKAADLSTYRGGKVDIQPSAPASRRGASPEAQHLRRHKLEFGDKAISKCSRCEYIKMRGKWGYLLTYADSLGIKKAS